MDQALMSKSAVAGRQKKDFAANNEKIEIEADLE
jgi:hypothetical protein